MKDKSFKSLIDKYENGFSSIDDEKILNDQLIDSDDALHSWSEFIKEHKATAPKDFKEDLWKKFEPKTNSSRKLALGFISIAASVLVFLTLFFNNNNSSQEMTYQDKAALLNQAKEMLFDQDVVVQKNIIYEDNTIIIYTSK
jgi:hypothetical protein